MVDSRQAVERARVIREDVKRYGRDRASVDGEVLRRWHLPYLLETADMLDALAAALADTERERDEALEKAAERNDFRAAEIIAKNHERWEKHRADAAEARVAELEAALRRYNALDPVLATQRRTG